MQLNNSSKRRLFNINAFTLIEIITVCTIIGILYSITIPGIQLQIIEAKKKTESIQLDLIKHAIESSFESTDLDGINIASFVGSIPLDTSPTIFSINSDVTLKPSTSLNNDWYIKVARELGYNPLVGIAPTRLLQPQISNILYNNNQNARLVIAGPSNEVNQQRYMIISLLSSSGLLQMPQIPDVSNSVLYLSYFNDFWDTDWNYSGAALPKSWISALTTSQVASWQSNSNMSLLRVQRIVCPKYSITINNTHPSDNCYIYLNFNGLNAGSSSVINSNSGTFVIPSILAGRQIQAYRGANPPPNAILFSQFILRDNCEITLQD